MKILSTGCDGGLDSGVTGFWLIEWKKAFSIVLLKFAPGSREAYHNHAFNAVTFWLKGTVVEEDISGAKKSWKPGFRPKLTKREKFHRVIAGDNGAWALSFRGPWNPTWREYRDQRYRTLSSGRLEVAA